MEELKKVAEKISRLEIQGATNVAIEGVKAFGVYLNSLDVSNPDIFFEKVEIAQKILVNARATEPCLRNGLNYSINKARFTISNLDNIDMLKSLMIKLSEEYLTLLKDAKFKIARIGAQRIPDNSLIMTHCHSSAVTQILIEASKTKSFEVINTETRPRYQGRITAKELSDHGIKVTHVVDSGMRWVVNHFKNRIDLILIGADSITTEGTIFNKIGSRLLALMAKENHIPLYVVTTILKYNPDSMLGNLEEIEMRPTDEIWENPPKGVTILNPAFETVSRDLIASLITEIGIFPSTLISEKFEKEFIFLSHV
ncbi:MAG: hypothetical protein EAX96_10815 [Candidatus Lokiarchaeota archaeon]|nr:hypothetical protein [Candidatus Lokiarchaeota archaeon]